MNNLVFVNFAIAAFAYYLFSELVKILVTDAPAQKIFLIVLLILCIAFALGANIFFHV